MKACKQGNIDVVKLLLDYGAAVNIQVCSTKRLGLTTKYTIFHSFVWHCCHVNVNTRISCNRHNRLNHVEYTKPACSVMIRYICETTNISCLEISIISCDTFHQSQGTRLILEYLTPWSVKLWFRGGYDGQGCGSSSVKINNRLWKEIQIKSILNIGIIAFSCFPDDIQ